MQLSRAISFVRILYLLIEVKTVFKMLDNNAHSYAVQSSKIFDSIIKHKSSLIRGYLLTLKINVTVTIMFVLTAVVIMTYVYAPLNMNTEFVTCLGVGQRLNIYKNILN